MDIDPKEFLDWIFERSRLIVFPKDHPLGDYPIEHNAFAQKQSRQMIEALFLLEKGRGDILPRMLRLPVEPPAEMWSGLPRDIVMWMQLYRIGELTPKCLYEHLTDVGRDIPAWMHNELEMQSPDHTISKGTLVVLIYKAMLHSLGHDVSAPVNKESLPEKGTPNAT